MNLYLLDTNILIDLSGKKETKTFFTKLIEEEDVHLATSILCVAEFLTGASTKETQFLEAWIKSGELLVCFLDDISIASRAARLRKEYQILLPDALILATAHHMKASLLTHDREFLQKSKNLLHAQDPFEK